MAMGDTGQHSGHSNWAQEMNGEGAAAASSPTVSGRMPGHHGGGAEGVLVRHGLLSLGVIFLLL